jgi:hypothetical protein
MPKVIRFDQTGTRLAALVGNTRIRIWDVASLRPVSTLEARTGAKFSANDLNFINGNKHFIAVEISAVSGVIGRHLRVWDVAAGMKEIVRFDDPYFLRWSQVPLLANADKHGARLWPLESDPIEIIPVPDARFCCREVTGSARQPFTVGYDDLTLIDATTGETMQIAQSEGSDSISAAAFTRDLTRVYVAERDVAEGDRVPGAVRLRSVPEGTVLAEIRPDATIAQILALGSGGSAVLLGTPGGTIVGGRYERAWLWHPDDDRLTSIETEGDPIGTAAASPDGRLLAIGFGNVDVRQDRWHVEGTPRVEVRDIASGETVREFPFERPPGDIVFSRDGRIMVARDSFEFVAFETEGWTELRRARVEHGLVGGRTALLGDDWIMMPDQNGLRMASILTGEEAFLPQRARPRMSLAADGRTFALVAREIATVWRLKDSRDGGLPVRQLARFPLTDSSQVMVFPGSDGKLYISGQGFLRRAIYGTTEIEVEVCHRIGRGLTDEEIAAHFADWAPQNPCVRSLR